MPRAAAIALGIGFLMRTAMYVQQFTAGNYQEMRWLHWGNIVFAGVLLGVTCILGRTVSLVALHRHHVASPARGEEKAQRGNDGRQAIDHDPPDPFTVELRCQHRVLACVAKLNAERGASDTIHDGDAVE